MSPQIKPQRPNILLITCDQYRFPRFAYGKEHGFAEPLKQILGFQDTDLSTNPYAKFFPGLIRLRNNATVLRNHTIAASACTPSRTVIYTGQYGTRTGVTQTDGLFKNGDASNFPWLDAAGIPTLGDWMHEAGYSTHYFGKWHVSNPPEHSLKRYGFDDWESSYPEPHGSQNNNLGVYRDVGFMDSACAFLRRQGLATNYNRVYASMLASDPGSAGPDISDIKPWFAVASFTNPHDIATYPGVIAQALPADTPAPGKTFTLKDGKQVTVGPFQTATQPMFGPLTVPAAGDATPPPVAGTMRVPLNPDGFPQDCANNPQTQHETLSDKPTCQHEYAYKMGMALGSKAGFNIVAGIQSAMQQPDQPPPLNPQQAMELAVALGLQTCIPFQLTDDPDGGVQQFLQLYAWLHAVVDVHVNAVLQALEDSGQADNTIVMFLADHGEYAGAHGMMIEKWHTAYQESLHVPVVVSYRPMLRNAAEQAAQNAGANIPNKVVPPHPHPEILRQCDALTSHVDILPTVLGLAGFTPDDIKGFSKSLSQSRPVPPLPGVDLSPLIRGEWGPRTVKHPDGTEREGVLFITDDEITAPLSFQRDAADERSLAEFEVYNKLVEVVRSGTPGKKAVELYPSSVKQPNHVRCVRTAEYKLARYFDPSGAYAQEWEMYDIIHDPIEAVNLVSVQGSPPKAAATLPKGVDRLALQAKIDALAALLEKLERHYLS
ncbi:MAG TPA: sulfatase-like hydrolase/transferase [Rhizomicrobium sp.]|nr:sulfatase-like hydrolase/transferase [Rhizomicrobium sp.]